MLSRDSSFIYGDGVDVRPRFRKKRYAVLILGLLILCGLFLAFRTLSAPNAFPINERIEIPFGTSLVGAARIMEEHDVVRSAFLLQLVLIAQFSEDGVRAGVYQFTEPLSTQEIAHAITSGTHGVPLVRVTVPEGLRNQQIDDILDAALETVKDDEFGALSEPYEGYLFPETYHVPETYTAEQFVALMQDTFDENIAAVQAEIDASERTLEDIIIMASILEREADSEESMRLVAGILWDRIDIGMALQVDASFSYLLGKTSEEITLDDLQIDSPYNTYLYRGLPPTPINNPGMQAIRAAIDPTPSPYLYYLTAPDGTFYYAETFAEHEENIRLYLRP